MRNSIIWLALLALLPFIQLGYSYYVSIAALSFVTIAALSLKPLLQGGFRRFGYAAIVAAMGLSLLHDAPDAFAYDLLRLLREGVFFLVLVFAIPEIEAGPRRPAARGLKLGLAAVVAALFAVAVIQVIEYRAGAYFGLPASWFAQDQRTLPTDLDLTFSQLRPNATFSEPSYLAFILISIIVCIHRQIPQRRLSLVVFVVAVLTGLISHSVGFVAFLFLILLTLAAQRSTKSIVVGLLALPLLLTLFWAVWAILLSDRLESAASLWQDESINDRVIAPAIISLQYLVAYPFGAPVSQFEDAVAPFADRLGVAPAELEHNALLNAVFYYGVTGIAMIVALILSSRDRIFRLYLLSAGTFNGSVFSPDKASVILLVAHLMRGANGRERRDAEPRLRPALSRAPPPARAPPVAARQIRRV